MNSRTFTAATDNLLSDLILGARQKLVFIAPGVTKPVAEALGKRFQDEGNISITVILDADPEVYRLGYGTMEGITALREYADQYGGTLRRQEGIRIAVLISDEQTLIYAPTPQLIEAEPKTDQNPNAIMISGGSAASIAEAAGATETSLPLESEIGKKPLTPADIKMVEDNLKASPPAPFDLERQAKVFSSKLQYVELKIKNYKLSSKEAKIPHDLLGFDDDNDLKDRWRNSIRVLDAESLTVLMPIKAGNDAPKVKVNQRFFDALRKKIEDDLLTSLPGYGNVLFKDKQQEFEQRVENFKLLLEQYHTELKSQLSHSLGEIAGNIAKNLSPRVIQNPPPRYKLHTNSPSKEDIESFLQNDIQKALSGEMLFEPPLIHYVFKDIAYQSFKNNEFIQKLYTALKRKGLPEKVLKSIFKESLAVMEREGQSQLFL